SPPTTTSRDAPPSAASRASVVSSPGRLEKSASPSSPAAAARRAISGHRRPVAQLSDAGLTRKTLSFKWSSAAHADNDVGGGGGFVAAIPGRVARSVLLAGRRRRECDPRHPVDRGAQ